MEKGEQPMRIPEVATPVVHITIKKEGPGAYVVGCDTCGFRDEVEGSLTIAKAVGRTHRIEHAEVDR
jgi:hypothetical protein